MIGRSQRTFTHNAKQKQNKKQRRDAPVAPDDVTANDPGDMGAVTAAGQQHITYEAEVCVVMNTGQYRVVRRLLAAVGLPVQLLRRTAVGCVSYESLAAAGANLRADVAHKDRASVVVPQPLVEMLWQAVGGVRAVWERRLEALRAQAETADDVGETEGGPQQEQQERLRLQQERLRRWLAEQDSALRLSPYVS